MSSQEEPNEYEETKRRRVQRNQQVLRELGLLQLPLSAAGEASTQRRAPPHRRQQQTAAASADEGQQQAAEPPRKSRRLLGKQVENAGMRLGSDDADARRAQPARPPAVRAAHSVPSGGSDPNLDAHNVMRVKSMTDRALQTRIWKIRRVDKMESFVKVLDRCGKAELAAEARNALQAMTGGEQ